MNWRLFKYFPIIDTRAYFIAGVPPNAWHLDIGSSDGETLCHMHELRSDLSFFATDIQGKPDAYPKGCEFIRGDIQCDPLPWSDSCFDSISCLQLLEHLSSREHAYQEIYRLLKPGGKVMIEIPHPKTTILNSPSGPFAGTFTINFYDDPTHTQPLSAGRIAHELRSMGFTVVRSGISRNWLFAMSYIFLKYFLSGRKLHTSYCHFVGWSQYVIASK